MSGWRERLAVGDLRTTGAADMVARELIAAPSRADELIALLFDSDRGVRMRAADALQKASVHLPGLLAGRACDLLACAETAETPELRWHLAQLLAQASLSVEDRARAVTVLQGWLDDHSIIVRVETLQALASIASSDAAVMSMVDARLRRILSVGRPAEKARARRLLRERAAPPD
jgi:HEAT repeat protein